MKYWNGTARCNCSETPRKVENLNTSYAKNTRSQGFKLLLNMIWIMNTKSPQH